MCWRVGEGGWDDLGCGEWEDGKEMASIRGASLFRKRGDEGVREVSSSISCILYILFLSDISSPNFKKCVQ